MFYNVLNIPLKFSLREKCPNMELFLVGIEENTDRKYLRIWTLLTQCLTLTIIGVLYEFPMVSGVYISLSLQEEEGDTIVCYSNLFLVSMNVSKQSFPY